MQLTHDCYSISLCLYIINLSKLNSENKLILKPPLKIDEVIKQFDDSKNNIKVFSLSSADFIQMLLSGKGTKDISKNQ